MSADVPTTSSSARRRGNRGQQSSIYSEATQRACGLRWKIEQLHREGKHLTGLEHCQCEKPVSSHIGCALLVWIKLKTLVAQTRRTVYQSPIKFRTYLVNETQHIQPEINCVILIFVGRLVHLGLLS